MNELSKHIREQNDCLRTCETPTSSSVYVSSEIKRLIANQGGTVEEIWAIVQGFSEFTSEDDPRCEHDFGRFVYNGADCCWEIDDRYDGVSLAELQSLTLPGAQRLIAVMLFSEY